jgi:hypothetical protein
LAFWNYPREFTPHTFFIIGFGTFGQTAFEYLKSQGICIIFEKELNFQFHHEYTMIEAEGQINNLIELINSKSLKEGSTFPQYFIHGSVEMCLTLLKHFIPELIIPTAPIHVMAEIFKEIIITDLKNLEFTPMDLHPYFVDLSDFPTNLNYLFNEKNKIYFSYAKFDEKCPDSCFGPLNYCPNFHRKKSKTINEFLSQVNLKFPQNSLSITFISHQLKAGLGGIKGNEIISSIQILQDFYSNYPFLLQQAYWNGYITISTVCNCHGVLEAYLLQKF